MIMIIDIPCAESYLSWTKLTIFAHSSIEWGVGYISESFVEYFVRGFSSVSISKN